MSLSIIAFLLIEILNVKIILKNDIKKNVHISGLIVAAGLSSRMGKFKPLLTYNGKTFLENIIQKLNLICDEIIIVTGFNSNEIVTKLENISFDVKVKFKIVHNEIYEKGMFTSLQKGLENCNSDYIVYHFVDQPNIPEKFYLGFVDQINKQHDWIQPILNERKGHPILMNAKVKKMILEADKNSNLRYISNSKKINKKFWECNFEEIFTDIDTQNDYKKLKGN